MLNQNPDPDRDSNEILTELYGELRQLAASMLAHERAGHTLTATALVHEAYLKLLGPQATGKTQLAELYADPRRFFGAAAEAMRRILIDNARRKRSLKRGGGMVKEDISVDHVLIADEPTEIETLDEGMNELEKIDPQTAELVKLRFYAGLTIPKAAQLMGISPRKANFLWAYGRAWLRTWLLDQH
jgi:RNA polymerase sigma factor (TIGR02999 family)